MFLVTSTLIFITAVMHRCHAEHLLKCPYDSKHKNLMRVWCKRDASNVSCCTGFSFSADRRELDGGRLGVTEDPDAFTVSIRSLSQGDGVYWCGLEDGRGSIIKLAETELHSSMALVWTVSRYVLFALLVLSVISTHICCSGGKSEE